MKTITMDDDGQIAIPEDVRQSAGLKPGTLELHWEPGGIRITALKPAAKETTPDRSMQHRAIIKFVEKATGRKVERVSHGREPGLLKITDFPEQGQIFFTSLGLSDCGNSLWRGKPMGLELSMTVTSALAKDLSRDFDRLIHEHILFSSGRGAARRPPVGYRYVFAPGYEPHFFFCSELNPVPALGKRKKVGDRYVEFLPAIPISDVELREYDRSVPELVEALDKCEHLDDWTAR